MEPEEFLKKLAELIQASPDLYDGHWATADLTHLGKSLVPNVSVRLGKGIEFPIAQMYLNVHNERTVTMSREHYDELIERSARLDGLEK